MRFHLHVGSGKTGTSAIQSALARHRATLHAAGLHYPTSGEIAEARAVAGELNPGNGEFLMRLAIPKRRPRDWDVDEFHHWFAGAVRAAGGRDILVSAESLAHLREDGLRTIVRHIERAGYAPHVIFYVRHVLDVRVAEFAQYVKLGVVDTLPPRLRTLQDYVVRSPSRWLEQLRTFAGVVGREALTCRLYDADSDDLPHTFLAALDPTFAAALPRHKGPAMVNRTPNAAEFILLSALNELSVGRHVARLAANALLNAPPLVDAARLTVTPATYKAFARLNQPEIDTINAEFLSPETPLQLTSGKVPVGRPPELDPADIARLAAHCLFTITPAPQRRRPGAERADDDAARPQDETATARVASPEDAEQRDAEKVV